MKESTRRERSGGNSTGKVRRPSQKVTKVTEAQLNLAAQRLTYVRNLMQEALDGLAVLWYYVEDISDRLQVAKRSRAQPTPAERTPTESRPPFCTEEEWDAILKGEAPAGTTYQASLFATEGEEV